MSRSMATWPQVWTARRSACCVAVPARITRKRRRHSSKSARRCSRDAESCLVVDETIDLPVTEHPAPVLLDQVIGVTAGRPDRWTLVAVLHRDPVGERFRVGTVQFDHDICAVVNGAWPRLGGFSQAAYQCFNTVTAGSPAKRSVPGAVHGEQCGHVDETVIVEAEAVFRHEFADGVFLFELRRHVGSPSVEPSYQSGQRSRFRSNWPRGRGGI